jgi:cobalt-precorrin 5A hydrolase
MTGVKDKVAIYALTLPGLKLAEKISIDLKADLCLPKRLKEKSDLKSINFETLSAFFKESFRKYSGHIVIAATGLVVREIAPYLKDKKSDPAVVTLGQDGKYVISLLSGHLGGANLLAEKVAKITQGTAIINTATDIAKVPAMEMVARERDLTIADFKKLPAVSRELSEGAKIPLYDPYGYLTDALKPWKHIFPPIDEKDAFSNKALGPSVYVDYHLKDFPKDALVLIPKALALGMGCHKGIELDKVKDFVTEVFEKEKLSLKAVAVLATVEIRKNEPALNEFAKLLACPFVPFPKSELSQIQPPNPSDTVLRRIGVPSVCEAAALLAARTETLEVPKTKGQGVTLALAKMSCSS